MLILDRTNIFLPMLEAFLFGKPGTLNLFPLWLCKFGRRDWGFLFCCLGLLWGELPFGLLRQVLRVCLRCLRGCLFLCLCICWRRIVISRGGLRFVFRLSHVFPRWTLPLLLLLLAGLFLLQLRTVISSYAPITHTFGRNLFKHDACHRLLTRVK